MSFTDIGRKLLEKRQRRIEHHYTEADALQRRVLEHLLERGSQCEYGMKHNVSHARGYEGFAASVPVNDYEAFKGDIDRMRHGEADVLWPGTVKWFAKSSGTTNDKSKFIPVTPEGLRRIHYEGGSDVVALYLRDRADSRLFAGRSLILGGSHSPNYNLPGSLVGDLSAILIENISPIINLIRVPSKKTALLSNFELKRDRIAHETATKDVTNISGVPSWMLSVLVRVLEVTGKTTIDEVWPNLEVFFHGGIAFEPYRAQYRKIIRSERMQFMETYNASEGFFGIQDDKADRSMLLMLDYDVFYEFVPAEEAFSPERKAVPLWGVETGRNYAMLITTSCGLWRYMIGDTVRFTSLRPYKFVITGRTKYFINAFGEELIQDNAEKALAYACEKTGAEVMEYTAAPVFMDSHAKARHQWLVEFAAMPNSLSLFKRVLDAKLQEVNSDYEAKRAHDITLQAPDIVVARPGLFNDWLRSRNMLGGQHKVPRLSNDRNTIEKLLEMNGEALQR